MVIMVLFFPLCILIFRFKLIWVRKLSAKCLLLSPCVIDGSFKYASSMILSAVVQYTSESFNNIHTCVSAALKEG